MHFPQESIGLIPLTSLVSDPVYAKPFLVVMLLMFLQQFCGVNVVTFYIQTIFSDAGSEIDPGLSATIVSLTQAAGTVLVYGGFFVVYCRF